MKCVWENGHPDKLVWPISYRVKIVIDVPTNLSKGQNVKISSIVVAAAFLAVATSCSTSSGSQLDPGDYLDFITTCSIETTQKYGQQEPILTATICNGQYWYLHPEAAKEMCKQNTSSDACLYADWILHNLTNTELIEMKRRFRFSLF